MAVIEDYNGTPIGENGLGHINYENDYYSGSQVQIMIGDILIDSSIGINIDVSQSRVPVYGYAKQYYSFLSKGKIVVQGQLAISFKETGYLLYALKRYARFAALGEVQSPRYKVKNGNITRLSDREAEGLTDLISASKLARKRSTMRANVEQMFSWAHSNHGTHKDNRVYNNFLKQLGSLNDGKFEDWAEAFEDAIWYGSDVTNPFLRDQVNSGNLDVFDDFDEETVMSHRRADQYPPVDIWVIYGNMNKQQTNHTVQKIIDVNFLGSSRTIQVSEVPVVELYPFIARNLV